MLALSGDFRRLTPPITVNGRAVYCAAVRRWPSRQARQHCSGRKRQHFANPALRLNGREILYVRNSGCRAAPDEKLWRAGGTPETHLVPLFCGAGAAGCGHKTFPVRISIGRKCKWWRMEALSDTSLGGNREITFPRSFANCVRS